MSDSRTRTDPSELDVEPHRLATNDDETLVDDGDPREGADVEAHRLATNDDETIVTAEPARLLTGEDADETLTGPSLRR
jgi:hypothetical protein